MDGAPVMTPLESLLAEVRAAEAKASAPPWQRDQSMTDPELIADSEFCIAARTYVPKMALVIEVLLKYGDFPRGLKDGGYGDKFRAAIADALAGSEGAT